jgi:23S rRNA pseudouridine1911/1915/1917 synthase
VESRHLPVVARSGGARLDRWLVGAVPALSRARIQALIDAGHVRVDGARRKPSYRVVAGERVEIELP